MAADPTSAAFQLRSPVMSTLRSLRHVMPSVATSDGAGVKLRRSIGRQRGLYLDPLLMLDELYTDNPDDYPAGFTAHPHRRRETVPFTLAGPTPRNDKLSHAGEIAPGHGQGVPP